MLPLFNVVKQTTKDARVPLRVRGIVVHTRLCIRQCERSLVPSSVFVGHLRQCIRQGSAFARAPALVHALS